MYFQRISRGKYLFFPVVLGARAAEYIINKAIINKAIKGYIFHLPSKPLNII
jgi:hypothetical protein